MKKTINTLRKIKCALGFHNLKHIKTLSSGHLMCGATMSPYLRDVSVCKRCGATVLCDLIVPTPKNIRWEDK